ncbi:putative oxidoreductase with NAD(P)-binding Rossmann-fold domain, putative 3-hydroxyisobutyrate dehydrogenase [Escherichia coli 55989]|nr:putative oxidoreductase with NAD(P)-binding Rossmann-fold domain, putative 3-hydroxyisobutyrate dehydrogenase [Escherichia coli 55989]
MIPTHAILVIFVLSCLILSSSVNLNDANDQISDACRVFEHKLQICSKTDENEFSIVIILSMSDRRVFMATIAFLGLGQMGSPMANNLLQKGHSLQVFDVNAQAVDALVTQGATAAQTPAEAAAGAEFIITMLPNGDIVRQVLLGEKGVCEAVSSDALLIDMSTIHPLQTDALIRELQEKGISMMDAPVGRTSVNAIDGTLLILAGGTDEQIARARPILMCMGNELVEAGGPGMGIRVKLINNYMSIALNALSSEAAVLCESLGLNLDVAIKVMSGTAAGKGHFTTTWPCKVLKGDLSPAFMVDLALKDLRIAVDVARETGAPLNMGIAAESYYAAASQDGKGRQDWSALLNQVRQQAGL